MNIRAFSTLILVAVVALFATAEAAADLARGFSERINWVEGLEKAKEIAKTENKPIVVLIHKTWCGACKNLKKDFQTGGPGLERVIKASENFVMVNLQDDESSNMPNLEPGNAGYIPRAVFLDAKGNVHPEVKSTANEKYPYFYPSAASLADVMESSLPSLQIKSEL